MDKARKEEAGNGEGDGAHVVYITKVILTDKLGRQICVQ